MPNRRAGAELARGALADARRFARVAEDERRQVADAREVAAAQHFLAVAEQAALVGLACVEECVAGEVQHVECARAQRRENAGSRRIATGEHVERDGLATEQLLQRVAFGGCARQVPGRIDDQQHAQRIGTGRDRRATAQRTAYRSHSDD